MRTVNQLSSVGLRTLAIFSTLTLLVSLPTADAAIVSVNFDDPSLSITDTTAGSTFGFYNDSASVVEFNTVSGFGLNPMAGGDRVVMRFPQFSGSQGLIFNPNVAANGGGTFLNQYTMMWDLYFDSSTVGPWMSLYQTNATNSNDGDLFIRNSDRGLGISGAYAGVVTLNEWNRVGVTVDMTLGSARMRKFINGVFVGTNTLDPVDGRWSMYRSELGGANYLLTDNNLETSAGWISAFYFSDQVLSDADMTAWGGANSSGFSPTAIPEPGSFLALAVISAGAVGYARRKRIQTAEHSDLNA